jgi:DNA-directed RNA polymerase subunit omega
MIDRLLIEKCLEIVPNAFYLVVLAARRAQELSAGVVATVPREGSKDTLVAIKEIAQGALSIDQIENRIVSGFQKFTFLMEEKSEHTS